VQAFVQRGGRVIVMEQAHLLFPTVPLEDKPVLTAFVRAADYPVLDGLTDDDFAFWGDDPYPLIAGDAYVANKLYRKDDGRLMLPLLDAGEGGFGHGDLECTPLFEAQDGEGLILACQLRITDKLHDTPAAERLFLNLLHRATTYQSQPSHSPIVVDGAETYSLAQYINVAQSGQTIIVNDATPESLHAWGELLNVDLRPRDVGDVYQVVRKKNQESRIGESVNHLTTQQHELQNTNYGLLSGVSSWDTCGIETYSYAHDAENVLVGSTFLEPTDGLEALLITPTESCLRELFVYGGHAEALRAHTLSRFLHAEKREEAVALGYVAVGEGHILFNQFAPPKEKHPRYARLHHRLLAHLGQRFEGSLLDSEQSDAAQAASPGYPQHIYTYIGPCDAALWQHMVQSTLPSLERMLATPILNVVDWSAHTDRGGIWHTSQLQQTNPKSKIPFTFTTRSGRPPRAKTSRPTSTYPTPKH
jgi:beta-galactosidase